MHSFRFLIVLVALFAFVLPTTPAAAQPTAPQKSQQKGNTKKAKKTKPVEPFAWVNKVPASNLPPNIEHATFHSPSMNLKVGYYIYLPTVYRKADANTTRYPVVYMLHGGRPGSEKKMIKMAKYYHKHMESGAIEPTIYVFPNGGPISWYNFADRENSMGEDVFVKEVIPHIDATYRTIANREGRGIEGFSQGGRGTTRIAFKYPELFVSVAPGGSGYGPEKRIRDNDGWESSTLRMLPVGNNCWNLAKAYADRENAPKIEPLLFVGTKGFNYETNIEFSDYLTELGIANKKVVVENATHSSAMIYDEKGLEIMQHHQSNFVRP